MPEIVTQSARAFTIAAIAAAISSSCGQSSAGSDAHALNVVFGDEFLADNVASVRRRAQRSEGEERRRFLADWVLPSETHPTIRMNGQFTHGGTPAVGLYCPAIELIAAARRSGVLHQLRQRVLRSADPPSAEQQRAQAAMLFLIDAARGETELAAESASRLTALVQNRTEFAQHRQWPQVVAAWFGLRDPRHWELVADLVTEMRTRQLLDVDSVDSAAWAEQISSLHGLLQHLRRGGTVEDFTQPPRLQNWIPIDVVSARTKSAGFPAGHWRWHEHELQNLSSHDQSLLFYKLPLRGDFELCCELAERASEELHLLYAGEHVIPAADRQRLRVGSVGQESSVDLDPPITAPYGPPWLRILVRDNVSTTWFNGRMLRRRELGENHDPWLAIRATSSRHHPAIQNLRIVGSPVVPSEVNLCSTESLAGWWSYFDTEQIGPGLDWQFIEDARGKGLLAKVRPGGTDELQESLLRYYRPLVAGDALEYDFLYQGGRMHVHPFVDGLALLLERGGLSAHRLTAGRYEQTAANAGRVTTHLDYRRGPARLPLKEAAWNRCRLVLRDDALDVSLNGELVYSRPLKATRPRAFGFFRYADQDEVQIRNVVWRHASTPAFDRIEHHFVRREPNPLDTKLDTFQSFEHDFVNSRLPRELFSVPAGNRVRIGIAANGVSHVQTSRGGWADSTIVPVFRMHGDFDGTAEFTDLQVTESGGCAVVLRCEDGRVMQLSRRQAHGNAQRVYVTWRAPVGDGEFRFIKELLISEAMTGRLRVARRGDTFHFMIAEHDSPVFRLVGKQTIAGAGQLAAQLELRMIANEGGSARAIWTNVKLAAQKLTRFRFQADDRILRDEHWETIAKASGLRELILDATNIRDEDVARLGRNPQLRLLYLKSTSITSVGVQHLAKLKRLENLHLTSTRVDDRAADVLKQLAALQTLGLSYTRVGDAAVSKLSRLPQLRVLGLRGTAVTDDSIRSFLKMKALKRLDLRNADISATGVERIRRALPGCIVSF